MEDRLDDQSREEGDPYLRLEENALFLDDRDKHWKDDILDNSEEKGEVVERCPVTR